MATKEVYIKGKVKSFRHQAPNEWGKYSHAVYLTGESLETMRDLQTQGIKNQMHKDEDGYYMWFNRPTEILAKGKRIGLAPPLVVMADGITPLQGVLVGNGSDVTTKIEVYEFNVPGAGKKGKAIRWKATRIDNLVPYEPKRDFTDVEVDAVKGLADQPKPVF